MPTQLNFDEELRYPDDPSGITIPVLLTHGEKSLRVTAKVDTGAQVCLFAQEVGLRLGLEVEQGTPIVLSSIGGSVDAFGHEVFLQAGKLAFESRVYFAKYPGLPRNVLGRQG
ncbi:MAG: aspartyl protease family protein [Acidobacteriota bacterium]